MIFRLAVVASALALAGAQDPDPNARFEIPISAALAQAAGANVGASNAQGVFTIRERDTTTYDFRWEIEGVDGDIQSGFLHCGVTPGSTTEVVPSSRTMFDSPHGAENDGESIVNTAIAIINDLNNNACYVNFTTEAYPAGELRGNIPTAQINSDENQAAGEPGNSASGLMTAVAFVSSAIAAVASL